jgi:hypothetical protein
VLALGAAVTAVGTLIGRRAASPTGAGTHLYVLTPRLTGVGKSHPQGCLRRLMEAAGAKQHIGGGEFISQTAVVNHVLEKPLSLCAQDEFGAFLTRINKPRAGGFESNISKELRNLWGLNFDSYITPEWAGRKSEIVYDEIGDRTN